MEMFCIPIKDELAKLGESFYMKASNVKHHNYREL